MQCAKPGAGGSQTATKAQAKINRFQEGGESARTDLNVTGHDCDALGMQTAQVGVLEQLHQVIFSGILQGF